MIILLWALFFCDSSGAIENKHPSELFPSPQVLKHNVEFWKKIYAQYSGRQVIIHDSEDLSIIYQVVHLDSLFRGIQVSKRIQWKKIGRIKKYYKSLLWNLSKRRKLNIKHLTDREKYVASLFGEKLSKARLRRAAKHIRDQSGLKERFKQGLKQSGLYLSKMREIFLTYGLPEGLLVLPHVESSFNYKAYSKMGAAGIWQFTRGTARRYLKVNYYVDERLDPIRSTEAAAKLLSRNYQVLKTWPLAITAYNHGHYGMKRAKKKYGADLSKILKYYKSRTFKFASKNFYAEFLAALEIVKSYEKYFPEVEFNKPIDYIEFKIPHYVTVNALLKSMNVEVEEFASLNPALRSPVLRSKRRIPKNFKIRIPWQDNLDMEELYDKISSQSKFNKQIQSDLHVVRKGETLSLIATKHRVSVSDILAYNDINNVHIIYVGQNIRIPTKEKSVSKVLKMQAKAKKEIKLAEATPLANEEKSGVLDVPHSLQVETVYADLKKSNDGKRKILESKNISSANKSSDIDHLDAKYYSKTSTDVKGKKLKPVEIQKLEQQFATMEVEMAMALPDFHVELSKNLITRIVRSPYSEKLSPFFQEIAWPENGQVKVEPDETLGHYADWLEVSSKKLRTINGLTYSQAIRVGQPIWLAFGKVTPEEFHRRRLEYHQGIEEDFYSRFYVEGVKMYKVKRGENIWTICNRIFEMPYWLIKKYNPQVDLNRLIAGQELQIPIVMAKNTKQNS